MSLPERIDDRSIAAMQERLASLQQRVGTAPTQAVTILSEALEDLRVTMEELHVADEELHEQNEALMAARLTAETERNRYQELFDFAPHGYLVTDPLGMIWEANRTAALLLAMHPPHHLPGKPLAVFIAHAAQADFSSLLRRLRQLDYVQEWEISLQPRDGSAFPAALTVATMRNPQGELVGLRWMLSDITARKQAEEALKQAQETLESRVAERTAELQSMNTRLQVESAERLYAADKAQQAEQALRSSQEQLRQLTTYLQNAQEQERTRIARELHDELAQMLTSLRVDVSWLSRRALSAPVAWRERLSSMATMIDAAGESILRIGTELRPTVLDNLGLVAAIEWQLKAVHDRIGLIYTIHTPADELSLSPVLATTMFRIFQEALTNVVRHAEASRVTVRLVQHSGSWLLEIADNGKGITPEQCTSHTSLGLMGMRERAHLWGGEVLVQGQSGTGTTVTIRIPRDTATPNSPGIIRVLIADDHATVREGVRRFLADTADLVAAGEAGNAQEVFNVVAGKACDVVLLDVSLPGRDGLDVLQELKRLSPNLPVLMFSVHPEDQYAVRAFKGGAAGYLTKNSEPEVLVAALRKVAQGGRYVSPSLAERLAVEITTATDAPPHATLANREYQVLLMLAQGKRVKTIADELALSVKTISTYRQRILKKLHLKTTAELIRYTISHQLLR